jgi:glycerol kinase
VKFFLAIDQSTSASKVVLFDGAGNVVDKVSRAHRQHYPQAGWVEHDVEEIWTALLDAAGELLKRQAGRLGDIANVSITNQRETFVVMDRRTGTPLHRAIVWQCRRGDGLCVEQRNQGSDELVRARTGLRIDGYFPASKLQWLMKNDPLISRRLREGTAAFATIDAFLAHRLTDGETFATDYTNASRTLFFDIDRLVWDEKLCALWDVPVRCLPAVRPSDASFGATTLGGLLPRPVPICGVMGDSQASLFAHLCTSPGDAKITLGTGASIMVNIGAERRPTARTVTSLAWVRNGVRTYALEGMVNSAASTLSWLRDQLGIIASNEEAERLAAEVEPDDGVFLVPAFSGLGAPHWCDDARAAIVGLSAHSDRRHIARAALDSIAFQVRDVLELLRAESGVDISRLQCDGGLTSSPLLMQSCADLLGIELRAAEHPDCSALGAVWMGALGSGVHESVETLPRAESPRRFERKISERESERRCRGWARAVQQVLGAAQNVSTDSEGNRSAAIETLPGISRMSSAGGRGL